MITDLKAVYSLEGREEVTGILPNLLFAGHSNKYFSYINWLVRSFRIEASHRESPSFLPRAAWAEPQTLCES